MLLIVFVLGQQRGAAFLGLPAQWLATAFLPVLIGLVTGGYLSRFSGFGLVLEAALNTPVGTTDLTAVDVAEELKGDYKQSLAYLSGLSEADAATIQRLRFVQQSGYYDAQALGAYLEKLGNVEFLELDSTDGRVRGLVSAKAVQGPDGALDPRRLDQFVRAVESGDLGSEFPAGALAITVKSDETVVSVLRQLRQVGAGAAGVLSPTGELKGVIRSEDLERRILDAVTQAQVP